MEHSFKAGSKGLKGVYEGTGATFKGDKAKTEGRIPYHTFCEVRNSFGKDAKPNPAHNPMKQK